MGEIAEGILNGDFDEITGEYLGEGMGFPRSLHYENKKPNPEFGVRNYLTKKGFEKEIHDWMVLTYVGSRTTNVQKGCKIIQNEFGSFIRFCARKKNELINHKK